MTPTADRPNPLPMGVEEDEARAAAERACVACGHALRHHDPKLNGACLRLTPTEADPEVTRVCECGHAPREPRATRAADPMAAAAAECDHLNRWTMGAEQEHPTDPQRQTGHDEVSPPTREDVERLRDLRDRAAILKATWDAALREFEAIHAPLLIELASTQKAAVETLAAIKAAAEVSYAVTGCKKPAPGVEVRIKKTLAYDSAAVIAWAKASGAAHLVVTIEAVDTAKFEALVWARPSDYGDLVTVVETPRAQLATDLGAALAKADAA